MLIEIPHSNRDSLFLSCKTIDVRKETSMLWLWLQCSCCCSKCQHQRRRLAQYSSLMEGDALLDTDMSALARLYVPAR